MKTKEVTTQNIKFNLSTKPLVSEPDTYVPVNQITNKLITLILLITYQTIPGTNISTIQTINSTKTY